MFLYNLTLQKASAITSAIFGNFSAPKAQEIVVARGKILELLRPDDETGRVQSICSVDAFCIIRDIMPFRLMGANRDYIVVASDSGKITVLQFDPEKNKFIKMHEETYGKTGCRRIIPGQFLACDPAGRAIMIGAIEKMKLVYICNRDAAANLTISSPLDAHKANTICMSMCGVDVSFENPNFACLEIDNTQNVETTAGGALVVQKMLTFYELDLGLNHVTRKSTAKCDSGANMVFPVPGGESGPGGVIVCAENWIMYMNANHETVKASIPRRFGMLDDASVLVTSYAVHKQKNLFFFLVQSEYGDIFKVTLTYDEDVVTDVHVKYFDTVPPCTSMCVLKTGFLFCASELGNHYLFQFQGIGDNDDTTESNSALGDEYVYFNPRAPVNLLLIDEMESANPILDMQVADLLGEHTPQIYAICGRGPRSTLRTFKHGLAVNEMAVSDLPGNPSGVWAVKSNASEAHHTYIVVSFINATIVLSIGETVQEVTNTGMLTDVPTLSVSLLGDNSLLQIHPNGLRHIRADKRVNEWKCPAGRTITKSACNRRQVIIALSGGELVYFELDKMNNLMDVHRKQVENDVVSLAIAPIPPGRQRALHIAMGSFDNTVRIFSLEASDPLRQLTMQALPAHPTSLLLSYIGSSVSPGAAVDSRLGLHLFVGLQNGVMIRSLVDVDSGSGLKDARKRFLGSRPVRLFEVDAQGKSAVVAVSSRTWLAYSYQNQLQMSPLSYDVLEGVSSFSSEQCTEGLVCISGSTLRVVSIDRLGDVFNQSSIPLRYTPRKLIVHPASKALITIESDHNCYSNAEKLHVQAEMDASMKDETAVKQEEEMDEGGDENEKPTEAFTGPPRGPRGLWGSCIRVVDPATQETVSLLELEENEAAFSLCLVSFPASGDNQEYLAVGTVKDMQLQPRGFTQCFIHLYTLKAGNLTLMHKTAVEDVPLALTPFQGMLLAGVGKALKLLDWGRKKLLRKSENRTFPTCIHSLHTMGDRIYVGDMQEGQLMVQYTKADKKMTIFADSTMPRYLTASCSVDYDSMVCGDKFGNLFVNRLPSEVSRIIKNDPQGALNKFNESTLNGAAHKLSNVMEFHVGEMVTCIKKCSLVQSGTEVIFYSTLMGGLGICIPFTSREDADFFTHLEMHLRQEYATLCGRDHLSFRSFYNPVKDCLDGDLCERYSSLPYDRQKAIADELVSTPTDVGKKLEELRHRVL